MLTQEPRKRQKVIVFLWNHENARASSSKRVDHSSASSAQVLIWVHPFIAGQDVVWLRHQRAELTTLPVRPERASIELRKKALIGLEPKSHSGSSQYYDEIDIAVQQERGDC
jgi:hypothetical protein